MAETSTSETNVNNLSVEEDSVANSPPVVKVDPPIDGVGGAQEDYDIPKPSRPTSAEVSVYDTPRSSIGSKLDHVNPEDPEVYDTPRTINVDSNVRYQQDLFYDQPKSISKSPGTVRVVKKFPLLSKNYIINEASESNMMTKHHKPEVYDNVTVNGAGKAGGKTPLQVFEFPDPPKYPPDNALNQHYGVKNANGGFDVYAKASTSGSTLGVPPQLPPRNSPNSSPRSSRDFTPELRRKTPDNSSASRLRRSGNPAGKNSVVATDYELLSPSSIMNMESMACARCDNGFEPKAKIVNSNGELYHPQCFVCAQCFRPFPDGVFYEFEGRKYCEHDFHVLFAPCCRKCGEFIVGRVIKAMNATWHPQCFTCEMCHKELADLGFIKNQGRALCHECNAKVKSEGSGKFMCQKCHSVIDGDPLRFRGEVYHPYHFNCAGCGNELTSSAREVRTRPGYTANELNELYCLRCHDKMGIPICGACRRPIEERVVTALGKHWHVEHFVCAKCEKPFLGNRHYERKGLAYCETHFHQLFGNLCYVCNQVIQGDVFTALNKAWCVNHFACSSCDQKMTVKTKFYEVDLKPVCKKCYDRYPRELRLRLKKYHENEAAREQGTPLMIK